MTPDEVVEQAREIAAGFTRLVAELERAQAQAALASELQVELDRAHTAMGRARRLHRADEDRYCTCCGHGWPCPTVRVLTD